MIFLLRYTRPPAIIRVVFLKNWETVSNIIKNKFNSELIYNKKYLKGKEKPTHKKAFNAFICQ